MLVRELLDLVEKAARAYIQDEDWLERNAHMHDYRGHRPPQALVDAVVVGLCNTIAGRQGADWALYAKDLHK